MIIGRIFPSLGRLAIVIDVIVVAALVIWIIRDPQNAGAHVGGLFHEAVHALDQVIVFFESI